MIDYSLTGYQTYTPFDTPLLDSAGIFEMDITLAQGIALHTGTYSESDPSDGVFGYYKKLDYQASWFGGTTAYDSSLDEHITIPNPFTITISTLNDSMLLGSFSGDMYPGNDPQYAAVNITNGKFFIKIY